MTPLHYAVMNRDAKCTRMLLEAGALVSPPHHDMTPLLYAIEYGYEDIVHLLLDFKADVNTRNELSMSTLIFAIVCEHTNIAKSLVRLNADVNARDAQDRAPLTYVVEHGNLELLHLLINAKADVNTCDKRCVPVDCTSREILQADHILTLESKWSLQPAYLGSGSLLATSTWCDCCSFQARLWTVLTN